MLPREIRTPLNLDDASMTVADWPYDLLEGPLWVHVNVCTSRLKSHYGTGSMEGVLRESADAYPIHRKLVERGADLAARCGGLVWEVGAVAALLVTCEWAEVEEMVIWIRQAPAGTIGDLIRRDLAEPPIAQMSP